MKNIIVLSVSEVKGAEVAFSSEYAERRAGRPSLHHPYAIYLGEAVALQRQLMQRYGFGTDITSAEVIILISPVCQCCDQERALKSAAEKLKEQKYLGKIVTWSPASPEKSLEEVIQEAESA